MINFYLLYPKSCKSVFFCYWPLNRPWLFRTAFASWSLIVVYGHHSPRGPPFRSHGSCPILSEFDLAIFFLLSQPFKSTGAIPAQCNYCWIQIIFFFYLNELIRDYLYYFTANKKRKKYIWLEQVLLLDICFH